jgi:hypothetical protein
MATLRCLYQRAVEDGLIAEADNPAGKVAKPKSSGPASRISNVVPSARSAYTRPVSRAVLIAVSFKSKAQKTGPATTG